MNVAIENCADDRRVFMTIAASNRAAVRYFKNANESNNINQQSHSTMMDMDASDTCIFKIQINGQGSDDVDLQDYSSYTGHLIS